MPWREAGRGVLGTMSESYTLPAAEAPPPPRIRVSNGLIEIRAVRRNPREGWADDARRLSAQGGDTLVWPEVANQGDGELVW